MRRRVVIAVIVALALAACTRHVVLDPSPDSGSGFVPDAAPGNDGGGGDGGVQDGGSIGDAALAD